MTYTWRTPQEQEAHIAELQLRKAELERILALRRGKPGFAANATAIEAELATIAEEISSGSDGALQDDNP